MGILKKIGGIVLLLFSFGILLVFILSFYNIIFKGGKFDLMGDIITIPLMIGLMIYLFKWGLKVLKSGDEKAVVDTEDQIRWHAFLGISFLFLGLTLIGGMSKLISLPEFNKTMEFFSNRSLNITQISILSFVGVIFAGLLLVVPILGIIWIRDSVNNNYFDRNFWVNKIEFLKNSFKESFMNAFGYILGILFVLYLAFAPLISFENLTPLNKTINFIATLNIAFHATWAAFFFFTGKIK